jgi:hypothetical protein
MRKALLFVLLSLPTAAYADMLTARLTIAGGPHRLESIVILEHAPGMYQLGWQFSSEYVPNAYQVTLT